MIQTGSKSVVCNVWSEEAREASAEARKANTATTKAWKKSSRATNVGATPADHLVAADLHEKAGAAWEKTPADTPDRARFSNMHQGIAQQHRSAANGGPPVKAVPTVKVLAKPSRLMVTDITGGKGKWMYMQSKRPGAR